MSDTQNNLKKHYNIAVYVTIALAIVGVIALLWWLFGDVVAGIASTLFGGGGAVTLKRYVKADAERVKKQLAYQAQKATIETRHQEQAASDAAKSAAEKAASDAAISAVVGSATTTADLDQEIDQAIDGATAYYDKHGTKEGGFAGWDVLVFLWGVVAVVGFVGLSQAAPSIALTHPAAKPASAASATPTARQRQRVAKLLAIIARGVREHKALTRKYNRDTKKLQGLLKAERAIRAGEQTACAGKINALASRKPPPCWPYVGAGVAGTALACLAGVGVVFAVKGFSQVQSGASLTAPSPSIRPRLPSPSFSTHP